MDLIDKAALVAEITKRVKEGEIVGRDIPSSAIFGLTQAYKNVLSFLDTLEVKEVDLAKPFEGIKVQTSMESGSLDEIIVTTRYKIQKGERS